MNRQKALMKKYLSKPENHLCADCKRPSPTWASLNIGVFVCIKCSGCHREIGVHITKIKSVELDLWPSKSLTDFAKINNQIANAYWENGLDNNYDFQKIRDNEIRLIEFIRDKYEFRRWAKPNVPDPMSLIIQGRDLVKEFMNNGEAVKLYEKSNKPELERRIKHFGNKKEKKGKDFGILDKKDNNKITNSNINNNNMNQNNIANNNMNNVNNNNQSEKKGFVFIKKKPVLNNENNNNINNNTNKEVDLLGFGNEIENQNNNQNMNINNSNKITNNIFPNDIFSFDNNQMQLKNNNDNNLNNINNTPIQENLNTHNNQNFSNNASILNNFEKTNNETNKPKSAFPFIKKKHPNQSQNNQSQPQTQNNNINMTNNFIPNTSTNTNASKINTDINDLFTNNIPTSTTANINPLPINGTTLENPKNSTNILNTTNINSNKTSNSIINLFENDQLVDIFNIETPTSDAVLNLSKNLLNIYSTEEENKNNKMQNNTNSNYNVLNMNYPNININNYYPNGEQQNKNKPMMNNMNNNYPMNPMMGFNYPNQGGYMNNNFGFWYGYNGYNINMNSNYMNMGMNLNNNNGFNYKNDFYNEKIKEKDKEEQKPILLNNNSFELNLKRDSLKGKDDPFKNLVDFK